MISFVVALNRFVFITLQVAAKWIPEAADKADAGEKKGQQKCWK